MNTIFLDIDGVLYGMATDDLFHVMADPKILDMICKFHLENNCHVVITSTRRMFKYERDEIDKVFADFDYSYLNYKERLISRDKEIEKHVTEAELTNYVILDDNDFGYTENEMLSKHFIKIDQMTGLTIDDLIRAKNILNNEF